MATAYFRVEDDVQLSGRWFLNGLRDSEGTQFDARDFTYGLPVDLGPPIRISTWNDEELADAKTPLRVSRRRDGAPLDFTFADFDMPVVTARVASILAALASADIQRIPVSVDSHDGEFEIINAVSHLSCIDPNESEIMWWTDADKRPDKVGKPRTVTRLRIDAGRALGRCIFRPEGWEIAPIVSGVVKTALEEAGVSGVRFTQV